MSNDLARGEQSEKMLAEHPAKMAKKQIRIFHANLLSGKYQYMFEGASSAFILNFFPDERVGLGRIGGRQGDERAGGCDGENRQ